ncbi:FkbM family methyltransferase [Roseomonas sp. OT10]|uniref:FkbM family methyltransferase n=1 Tax=Roseomonas cutis TaxID=2897332 RepID=UPI001E2B588B|nr:FkbM family methyltransferase [Roseomonas sp. OT10]UFN50172.1 FkbM family methyltransferase [Roseomonas sp. OT10]
MADFRFLKPSSFLAGGMGLGHRPRPRGRVRGEGPHALPLFDLGRLDPQRRVACEAEIRALCQTVPLGGDTALCRALGRYKIFVDTRDIGFSVHLMLDGYWEMWVTEAMVRFVRGGMTVVDVGANLGYFTLLLSELVGAQGRVHAVEPNPRLAGLLRQSLAVNGFTERAVLHTRPLGAVSGQPVTLHVPEGLPQNGYVVPGGGKGAVSTATVDEIVGDGPVDFIKIDVEGAEQDVWRGMRGVLARRQPLAIFLEFNRHRYADPGGFLASIEEHGFSMGQIDLARGVQPVDRHAILARESLEDWMLVLARA